MDHRLQSASNMAGPESLWYTRCNSAPAASAFSIQKGWMGAEFVPDNVAFRPLQESAATQGMDAHFDHSHHDLFREGSNIPPLWACSLGSPVRIIGLHPAEHRQMLLSRPGCPIKTPADLRGARFGLPRHRRERMDFWAATVLRLFEVSLEVAGLGLDDIELVELDADATWWSPRRQDGPTGFAAAMSSLGRMAFQRTDLLALLSGQVDVIASTDFRAAEITAMFGANVVLALGAETDIVLQTSNLHPAVLTASAPLCDERPNLVARYLRRTMDAASWAASHRDAAVRLMADANATSVAAVNAGYAPDFHEHLTPVFDRRLLTALESQKDFLRRHGFIDNDFVIDDFIDREPMRLAADL